MVELSLVLLGGCVALDADRVQSLERSLEVARSPDFSGDRTGHLDVVPDGLLALEDGILACSEEGMSLTQIQDDGDIGKEWLEEDSSKKSGQAVVCQHLDWWGDQVALSAKDRVRIYDVYAEGEEPEWWEERGQTGPLGWARDLVETDEDWRADESEHDDWLVLDDVRSTAYSQELETGYIARCCGRRSVLATNKDGSRWDLLQLVPDEVDAPESLILATGKVEGSHYLFGAGEDAIHTVALDGGPDLPLPNVGPFLDGDRVQIRVVRNNVLWIGAGERSVVYTLSAQSESWQLSFDVVGANVLGAEDQSEDSETGALSTYTYKIGEGVEIVGLQTDPSCTQVDDSVHAYLFCEEKLSWTDARDQCRAYGDFDLVEIYNYDEFDWIEDQAPSVLDKDAWIGLNDRSDEGDYDWSTGDPGLDLFVGSSPWWATGEPDDAGDGQDCVALASSSVAWSDRDCSDELAYICESLN